MADRSDVKQGTLALMVLKTLETMGPLHGYGIARRIEQTSGAAARDQLRHALSGAAQARAGGLHRARNGASRTTTGKAKYYRLTRAGRKRVEQETRDWQRTSAILGRFLRRGEQS